MHARLLITRNDGKFPDNRFTAKLKQKNSPFLAAAAAEDGEQVAPGDAARLPERHARQLAQDPSTWLRQSLLHRGLRAHGERQRQRRQQLRRHRDGAAQKRLAPRQHPRAVARARRRLQDRRGGPGRSAGGRTGAGPGAQPQEVHILAESHLPRQGREAERAAGQALGATGDELLVAHVHVNSPLPLLPFFSFSLIYRLFFGYAPHRFAKNQVVRCFSIATCFTG